MRILLGFCLALLVASVSARPFVPANGEDGDRTPAGAALFARKLVESSKMAELATIMKGTQINGGIRASSCD
jgi:hypothetical protein